MSYPCLVAGCDYEVADDGNWHEELEQHVRWIHLPEKDFGENAVPTLFALLANGLIRPDEFAALVAEVIQKEMSALEPGATVIRAEQAAHYLAIAGFFTLAGLGAICATILTGYLWILGVASASLFIVFFQVVRLVRIVVRRPGVVRVGVYPDTTDDG